MNEVLIKGSLGDFVQPILGNKLKCTILGIVEMSCHSYWWVSTVLATVSEENEKKCVADIIPHFPFTQEFFALFF